MGRKSKKQACDLLTAIQQKWTQHGQATILQLKIKAMGFPGGSVVRNLPATAGSQLRSLVQDDPTGHGATRPVHRNYWACALKLVSHSYWARRPRACAPQQQKPGHRDQEQPRSLQLGKACTQQWRPSRAKKLKNPWLLRQCSGYTGSTKESTVSGETGLVQKKTSQRRWC